MPAVGKDRLRYHIPRGAGIRDRGLPVIDVRFPRVKIVYMTYLIII